jgi:hypothetical protein
MTRAWRVFRVLVFRTPSVSLTLSLFYGVAALLVVFDNDMSAKGWLAVAFICAVPTAAFFALASERTGILCSSAGQLTIPRHVEAVRLAQAMLIVAFVGVPVLLIAGIPGKSSWTVVVIIAVAAAAGAALVTNKFLAIAVVAVFFLTAQTDALWIGLSNPFVQAGLLIAALWVLYRWFSLPERAELHAAHTATGLADSTHEVTEEALGETFDTKALGEYEQQLSNAVRLSREEIAVAPGRAALAFGLGFQLWIAPPKSLLKWTALGALAVIAWHFFHGSRAEVSVYLMVTVGTALAMMTYTASVSEAWQKTSTEQSVLKLTPTWPSEWQLKQLFVRVILRGHRDGWSAWIAISLVALLIRGVTLEQLFTAAFAMFAASCASAAALGMLLTRCSLKEWHLSTVYALLSAVAGALVFAFRDPSSRFSVVIACALVLLPLGFGLALFLLRPLLFPVVLTHKE